jgi:phosphomevalonate kinase
MATIDFSVPGKALVTGMRLDGSQIRNLDRLMKAGK